MGAGIDDRSADGRPGGGVEALSPDRVVVGEGEAARRNPEGGGATKLLLAVGFLGRGQKKVLRGPLPLRLTVPRNCSVA